VANNWKAVCNTDTGKGSAVGSTVPLGPNQTFLGWFDTIDGAIAYAQSHCSAKMPPKPNGGGTDTDVGGAPITCPPGMVLCGKGTPAADTASPEQTHYDGSTCSTDCGPNEPSTPSKSKDNCCQEIQSGLNTVTDALNEINATLQKKLGKSKTDIDDIFDELLEKLREKFETGEKSCDECKQMLRNGLGGTIEYAVQCAGACIDKAACECSMGNPDCWGEPCEGCGEPCCKCDKGICKPEPCPEEKPDKKWVAWCSPVTGSIAVTKEGASPPGAGFFQVGMAASEQAAATIAAENCQKQEQPGGPITPPISDVPPITGPQGGCDFDSFLQNAPTFYTGNKAATNAAAGIAQAFNGIGRIGIDGINLNNAGEIGRGVIRAVNGNPGYWFERLMPVATAAIGCEDSGFMGALNLLTAIQSISTQAGCDLSPWTDQIKYVANARCRQQFMGPDQALAAFLANDINYDKLDKHWAIANYCPESVRSVVEASKAKPVPLQLAMMRRRRLIDAGGYAAGMRRLGYLESGTAEHLFQLTEQVPTLTDITRLMVRDADDESLVSKFGLDTQFEQKYGGQLREWSEFQGIPEKFARYYWRAHWSIPAPGQLFTFYQRLRDNPKFGGRDKVLEDIKAALVQQDILPYWHEHFLEVSFRPISRVDIRRMFNIGALTKDEVTAAYRQLGSSDENADKLTKFAVTLRDDAAAGSKPVKLWLKFAISRTEAKSRMVANGLPDSVADQALSDSQLAFASSPYGAAFVRGAITRQQLHSKLVAHGVDDAAAGKIGELLALKVSKHPALAGYALGVLDETDAQTQLLEFGIDPAVASTMLANVTQDIDHAFAAQCQRGIKRRYLLGEFDKQAAINHLLGTGLTNSRAVLVADNWDCEKSNIGKAVPTNRLCEWLDKGVISSLEFAQRLENIGHTPVDAARIRDDCLAGISVKRQKQAQKEAADQVALERREQAALKRQQAEVQRNAAAAERSYQKGLDTKRNRENQLLSAASKVSKKADQELPEVVQAVRDGYSRILRDFGFTPDESLALLIKSAEAWEGGDIAGYGDTITIMALGLLEPVGPVEV
jgi:hypothetical protein